MERPLNTLDDVLKALDKGGPFSVGDGNEMRIAIDSAAEEAYKRGDRSKGDQLTALHRTLDKEVLVGLQQLGLTEFRQFYIWIINKLPFKRTD